MKLETDSSCSSAKPRRENDTITSTNPWLIQRSLKAKNTPWKDIPKTRNDIQKQNKEDNQQDPYLKKTSPQAKARLTSSSHENSPSYLRKIHLLEKLPQRFSLLGVFPSSLPQKPPKPSSSSQSIFSPAQTNSTPPIFYLCWCLLQQANPSFPVHHISKHGLATTLMAAHVSCRVYEVVPFLAKGSPHPTKERKAHFSRVVAAKIKIIPLVLQ